ncbi:MAG TPA: cyclic nucleotide-binding domain-containing protein [Candidatus Ozemobacteraceae bacterium]
MLENIEFFSSLSPGELEDVAAIAHRVEYRRGEYIFRQGDHSRDLYVLESGQVEISTRDILQEPKILAVLKNGDLFGEMALFDQSMARSASARSLQSSVIIVIPGERFERLLKDKPAISFKLLGILSKRVKSANQQIGSKSGEPKAEARIITVASPRNGVGKTTFAVALAQILAHEKGMRTLYVDLDLPYADGTYAMGVHSVRTVVEFSQVVRGGIPDLDAAKKLLIHVKGNLSCLPGPVNLIDGEKADPKGVCQGIRQLQKFFDFIILDTDSHIEELFLGAIDLADRIFFLVDAGNSYALKSSTRYFFGLSKLNLPEDRMTLLAGKSRDELNLKALSGLLKLPVRAQLPLVANHTIGYGQSVWGAQKDHSFCQMVRKLLQDAFPVECMSERKSGFFSRLFGGTVPVSEESAQVLPDPLKEVQGQPLRFRETNFRALLRQIRAGLVTGQYDEMRASIHRLLDSTGPSSALYQTYGELLMQEGNLSEAITVFHNAVQLDPTNHLARGYGAILTLDRAEFTQTVAILTKKIENHPSWPDLRRDLGELYLRNNLPGEAVAPLRQALTMNPHYEDARIRLAETLVRLGTFDEALEILNGIKKKSAPALYLMGICYQSVNRFVEALGVFRILHKVNPSFKDVGSRIDDLQNYFDKLQSLISMHQKIRQEQPTYLDIRVRLAQLLATAGRREEALEECRSALQINPSYAPAQEELDRIGRMETIVFARPAALIQPASLPQVTICSELHIDIDFGSFGTDPDFHERLQSHVVDFRNLRTGKSHEFRLPPVLAKQMSIVASSLCPIAEKDLIQIRLLSPEKGDVLYSDACPVERVVKPVENLQITLEEPIRRIVESLPRAASVRHFLIGVEKGSDIPMVAVNTRNAVRAEGRMDPERAGRRLFLLRSGGDEDVVQAGDVLEIRSGEEHERVLSKFSLTPEDIANHTRFLGAEELSRSPTGAKAG